MKTFILGGVLITLSACAPGTMPVANGSTSGAVSAPQTPGSAAPTLPEATATTAPTAGAITPPTTPTGGTASPQAPSTGTVQALARAHKLVLSMGNRFFSARGEQRQIRIEVQDDQGKVLSGEELSFDFSSSRPQDFSVDATGRIMAEVTDGYSDIIVRLQGSSLQASQLVSVSSPTASGGGGGGGAGNAAPPTQETVNGQVEFQF
jgi:hypothetical protein